MDTKKTEINVITTQRIKQSVLRNYVLENYNFKCAICNINRKDLLICSHIVPWAIDKTNRLNPANAICFCVLHDKLFDRYYFSLDEKYDFVFGRRADSSVKKLFKGFKFKKPNSYAPDIGLLKQHTERMNDF